MVSADEAPLDPAFPATVDVSHGLTTGISAEQRSNPARALANPHFSAEDCVRPGRVCSQLRPAPAAGAAGRTGADIRAAEPNPIGDLQVVACSAPFDSVQHFACIDGDMDPPEAVPVRLHRSGIAAAAIGGGASIQATLRRIGEAGAGGLVYLRDGAAGGP